MRTPSYNCDFCGSTNLRRSRRQTPLELARMLLGSYPFRCVDCGQRFWINIWLFSKLAYAKCPKCLGLELGGWPTKHYRMPFWKSLLTTFGAHRYRCSACRCNFISFRPSQARKLLQAEDARMPEPVESLPETESKG